MDPNSTCTRDLVIRKKGGELKIKKVAFPPYGKLNRLRAEIENWKASP
jgi:hypothetical protein